MSYITRLAKIAENPMELQKLGSELVREAIKEAAAERAELKPARADFTRRVRPGEIVPIDVVGIPGFVPGKAADSGWEKTWTNLGIWERGWAENETGRIDHSDFLTISARLHIEEKLNIEEIAVLDELKIKLR